MERKTVRAPRCAPAYMVALASTVRSSRVGDQRGGVQDAPWLCLPFPDSCPFRGFHRSVSGPRHIEPDRDFPRFPASRLTGVASSIGSMRVDSHLKRHLPSPERTPITEFGRSRLRGSLAVEHMTGIGVGRASIQI